MARSALLALIVSLLISLPAYSLTHKEFAVGTGLYLNVPEIEKDLEDTYDELPTISAPLAVKELLSINEKLLLRTGLWLQEKAAKFNLDFFIFDGDMTVTTLYASVPLTLQYQLQNNFGLFAGYIADIRINDYCEADDDSIECLKNTNSVVHVATAGAVVDLHERISLEFSYQHGLSEVWKDAYKIHSLTMMGYIKF